MIHVALFGIEAALAAALTYLVHSTLWILGAMVLTRWHRALSPSARHVMWRAALIGPVASSAFALGLGHRWQWALTDPSGADPASAVPYVASLRPLPLASPAELVHATASGSAQSIVPDVPVVSGSATLALGWAIVSLGGLLLLARAVRRQRRAFASRTPVTDAASIEVLDRLARCAGLRHRVRLSCSDRASSPLVLSAREICLPERARELDAAALEAVFAHELAHIERRDGLWLHAALLVQAVLWFQPLNRKARAALAENAELAADDRAVELTGDALGLARTLTHVAGWVSDVAPATSLAMARAGSPIVERVTRLVHASDAGLGSRMSSRTPWFALAALTAIGACSPSVGAPQAPEPRAPRTSAGAAPAAPASVPAIASNPAPLRLPAPAGASGDAAPESSGSADSDRARDDRSARGEPRDGSEDGDAAQPDDVAGAEGARRGDKPRRPTRARQQHAEGSEFPIGDLVNQVVASVVPSAVAFSQNVAELAQTQQRLQERLRVVERSVAGRSASEPERAELERLRRELAETRTRQQRIERDFAASMETWSKAFEQRFDREFAPRFAAWGEDFGRRMQAMGDDLELQLGGLRPPMPPPRLPPMQKTSPVPGAPAPNAVPVPIAPPAKPPTVGAPAPNASVPNVSVPNVPIPPSSPRVPPVPPAAPSIN